jgi:hypothetical protein
VAAGAKRQPARRARCGIDDAERRHCVGPGPGRPYATVSWRKLVGYRHRCYAASTSQPAERDERRNGREQHFEAQLVPPGAELLLPAFATDLASGPWQSAHQLTVKVSRQEQTIGGVIPIDGLGNARATLAVDCPTTEVPTDRRTSGVASICWRFVLVNSVRRTVVPLENLGADIHPVILFAGRRARDPIGFSCSFQQLVPWW